MVDKIHFGVIVAPHQAEVHTYDMPKMGPEDVLIKMGTNNICTTDYQQWMGLRDHQGFPMADGHECAGIIEAVGDEVIGEYKVGDQVGVMTDIFCGICPDCRAGNTTDCQYVPAHEKINGYYGSRSFANYKVVNQKYIVKIANDIPSAEAGFLEPLATVIQGAKKVNIKPMEDVVVVGAGTMGLVNAQVAKAYGARVIITEISPKKLERAKAMNIGEVINSKECDPVQAVKDLTGGKGADTVIAAVGNTIAYKQGMDMLKEYRGKFEVFPAGYPKPEMDIDPNTLHYRRMEIIGTFCANVADFQDSATMISKRLVDMSHSLEGKVFPLRELQDAYAAAATPDAYRITVDLQGI